VWDKLWNSRLSLSLSLSLRHHCADTYVYILLALQASLASLQASINSQDWESATRHCARAMSLPPEVISGPFAERTVVRRFLNFPFSLRVQRRIFLAHIGESFTPRANFAGGAGTALGHFHPPIRQSLSITRRNSHQPFLQTLSCNRLGS